MKRKSSVRRSKETLVPITVKLPISLIEAMDEAVKSEDSDRSKFTRRAVRQQLGQEAS